MTNTGAQGTRSTLLVLSCSDRKHPVAAAPRVLYASSTTQLALAAADQLVRTRQGVAVRILSARHGLLDPDGPSVAPYDHTLPAREPAGGWSQWWADRAGSSELDGAGDVWVFAGRRYLAAVQAVRRDARRPDALERARGIGDHRALYATVRDAEDPWAALAR
jgi:hypothetical protein